MDPRLGEKKNRCGGGRGGEWGLRGQGPGMGSGRRSVGRWEANGLVVRGIRRGAGRMLGMEIQAPAGEEGGKP